MLNGESITERVRHLQERIKFLKQAKAFSRDAYLTDRTVQTAVERDFQVAIECCLDIAKHIIAGQQFQPPTELKQIFQALAQAGLLESEFAEAMTEFAKLRNRLVHWYMTIEPDKMYAYLQQDIPTLERFAAFAAGLAADKTTDSKDS